MTFGKIKKFTLAVAGALVVTFSGMAFSACEIKTAHPKARIDFEFNGVTYTVNYTLYRNMYPQTVQHFIELAKDGFYDNTVVHDYNAGEWFTGGYGYNAETYSAATENGETMSEYFNANSKEAKYYEMFEAGKFTPSVFRDDALLEGGKVDKDKALPVVMGEYKNNIQQTIVNGALTAEIGCLKMFYYGKETKQKVLVMPTSDQVIRADYKNNAATSMFSVQVGASSYSEANYTVFAKANDLDKLTDMKEAVETYLHDTYGTGRTDYCLTSVVSVDQMETYSSEAADKSISRTFYATKTPLIIKTVKITKY